MGICNKYNIPCKFWDCYGCRSTDGCWKEHKDEKRDFCMKKKESNEGSKD